MDTVSLEQIRKLVSNSAALWGAATRVMQSPLRDASNAPTSLRPRLVRRYSTHSAPMDDDLSFGASVWGAPASPYALKPIAPAFSTTTSSQDGFDDFDAFGAPEETPATSGDDADDDFGDFGDFGQPQEMGDVSAFGDEDAFGEEVRIPRPGPSSADWEPLRLDSLSSNQDLQEQVDELLGPLWATIDESQLFDEDIRQAGGLNQTLTTRER